jgi:diacylglycerol kinase (ATP)
MKPLVILNPRSQGGKTGRQAASLLQVIERYIGSVDCIQTQHPQHATELAEEAVREARSSVIAVGGDGTIHEVANGIVRAQSQSSHRVPLGVVGQGTGGDFRKSLELEHRLDRYCKAIAEKNTQSIDMGELRYLDRTGAEANAYFINILSVGIGGLVDRYMAESKSALGGSLAYYSATIKALMRSEIATLRCTLHCQGEEQKIELATRQIAICNGRYFGGGMEVAPMAKLDDGLFHVITLGKATRLKFMLDSLSIYSGKHLEKDYVDVYTCDAIDIELGNPSQREGFPLDVDGEPLGTLPLQVRLLPQALDVFCPA